MACSLSPLDDSEGSWPSSDSDLESDPDTYEPPRYSREEYKKWDTAEVARRLSFFAGLCPSDKAFFRECNGPTLRRLQKDDLFEPRLGVNRDKAEPLWEAVKRVLTKPKAEVCEIYSLWCLYGTESSPHSTCSSALASSGVIDPAVERSQRAAAEHVDLRLCTKGKARESGRRLRSGSGADT